MAVAGVSRAGGAAAGAKAPGGAVASARTLSVELGWLAVQALLLLALACGLRIEGPVFYARVAPAAILGAFVHHFLPPAHRLRFFALLSLGVIWWVFGVAGGTWLIAIGLGLIATCHLPVPRWGRIALLLLAAVVLGSMRARFLPTPFPATIWAILGSMFMFRLIVYVYDLAHAKERTTWEQRLAYFFCFPNVAFPLFPVIDFATFRRTWYDRPAVEIYREGINWIARGLTHLVLYRLVYQYFVMSPVDVRTGSDLLQYAVANYGLYLRVSGQFHLVVGLLHLFGFRLPETHRFFYLASSVNDFWRRINIYWKDFMQKVFYMPLYFRLMRAQGDRVAMIGATVAVFVTTWLFHGYQWFWILGKWTFSGPDAVYWGVLGACVVATALYESKHGRARTVGTPRLSARQLVRHGVQVALAFTFLCALWTIWTAPSLGVFWAMVRGITVRPVDVARTVGFLALLGAVAVLLLRFAHLTGSRLRGGLLGRGMSMAGLAGVAIGGGSLGAGWMPQPVHAVLANVRTTKLNPRDEDQLQRGYYEQLQGVGTVSGELWSLYARRPAEWKTLRELGAERNTRDARLKELVPGKQVQFLGAPFTINADGLRDRTYAREKPAGVLRMAILGQSYVMGSGVVDSLTFENVLEDRLTREWAPANGYARVEILNFAGPAFTAQQQRAAIEAGRIAAFAPDVVIIVGHRKELRQVTEYVLQFMERRQLGALPDTIAAAVESAGIRRGMLRDEALQRLSPETPRLLSWVYRDAVRMIEGNGASPVFAHIPMPFDYETRVLPVLMRAADAAGFAQVMNLDRVYAGHDESGLVLAEWDRHPNTEGHRLIADALFAELSPTLAQLARRPGRANAANGAGRATEGR
jgi:D-alanyl-lipoteichoic acid acyltransferase DltB (MBOAT superfamily)